MSPAEYATNIAARFGDGNLPGWPHLAAMENAAMNRITKRGSFAKDSEALRRRAEYRAAIEDAILSALTEPLTATDIANRSTFGYDAIQAHLARMFLQGMVTRNASRRPYVWGKNGACVARHDGAVASIQQK